MHYRILIAELTDDPLSRGYSGMTDAAVAESLNTADRSWDRDAITATELYESIVPGEFGGLTDTQKQLVRDLFGLGTVAIGPDSNGLLVLLMCFSAQSVTRENLLAVATESISRATELGLPMVKPGYVAKARLQGGLA